MKIENVFKIKIKRQKRIFKRNARRRRFWVKWRVKLKKQGGEFG